MAERGHGTEHRTLIETDYPVRETLDACVEIAERIESIRLNGGYPSPVDVTTLVCHLRVLRDDLDLTEQPS